MYTALMSSVDVVEPQQLAQRLPRQPPSTPPMNHHFAFAQNSYESSSDSEDSSDSDQEQEQVAVAAPQPMYQPQQFIQSTYYQQPQQAVNIDPNVNFPKNYQERPVSAQQFEQSQDLPSVGHQPTPRAPTANMPPRSRAAYNRYQREFLNAVFERIHYPSRIQREAISRCLGGVVNQNQIKVWFQNARRRAVLRGVKFPPGRMNPDGGDATMPPPARVAGPGSDMVDTYFATIRHFVNEIVELADMPLNEQPPANNASLAQGSRIQQKTTKQQATKRSRPSDDDDEDSDDGVASKRSAIVSPSVVASPNVTTDSVLAYQTVSQQLTDSVISNQTSTSPTDPRAYIGGSRASSGFGSSLGNYSYSPTYNSTPNQSAYNCSGNQTAYFEQQFNLANAMRAASFQQNYAQLLNNMSQSRSSCAFSQNQSGDFSTTNNYQQSAYTTPYNPYFAQNVYNPYFAQQQPQARFNASNFAAQIAAHLQQSSSSSTTSSQIAVANESA